MAYGDSGISTDLGNIGDFIDTTIHTQDGPAPTTLEEFKTDNAD